jgi:histidyl-tRNA synthetase
VRGPVVVIAFAEADMAHYLAAARELRQAGIAAEVYLGRAGMKAQMKYADRRGAPAAVILGGDELAAGVVTIKDLDAGRALSAQVTDNAAWKTDRPGQVTAPRGDLVAVIRGIIEEPSIK